MYAVFVLALFALVGCSNDSLSGSVSLEIQQQGTGPFYTEGSVSYVRVEARASGTAKGGVVEKSKKLPRGPAVLARLSVPAGRTTVMTWQRPCSGNCDHLDAPSDRCEVSFLAEEHAQVIVRTTYSPGKSCTADVEGAQ